MKKLIIVCLCVALSAATGFGQVRKTMHQVIEVDSATVIAFDLYGDKNRLVGWAGDNLLIETRIVLYECSEAIFEHFFKAGRYDIETAKEGGELRLKSKDSERRAIKTRTGECFEVHDVKIFVPDAFEEQVPKRWARKPKTN